MEEYINEWFEKSYDRLGIDYHINKDVYERIFLDGVKTGIAVMMMQIDEYIDNNGH